MAKHSHARRVDHPASPQSPASSSSPLGAVQGGAGEALELDRVIHERMRLAIVSALAVNPTLSFNEL